MVLSPLSTIFEIVITTKKATAFTVEASIFHPYSGGFVLGNISSAFLQALWHAPCPKISMVAFHSWCDFSFSPYGRCFSSDEMKRQFWRAI